jgi:DNA-binding NarL/FixJ family response regulator
MPVVTIVDDLIFREKIAAVAAHLDVPLMPSTTLDVALAGLAGAMHPLVLVDLNLSTADPIEAIRAIRQAAPAASIVGFCSHIQTDLQARAREAGCSVVWPRSVFVQRLPAILSEYDSS